MSAQCSQPAYSGSRAFRTAKRVRALIGDLPRVLAMNRLRNAYLTMAPALEPYLSTGHHDDERGVAASYLTAGPRDLRPWAHFLVTTPTIVAGVLGALGPMQRRNLDAIRGTAARFPTPPG